MSRFDSVTSGDGGRIGGLDNERAEVVLDDLDRVLAKLGAGKIAVSIRDHTVIAAAGSATISAAGSISTSLDVETLLGIEETIIQLIQALKYEAAADFCDQIIMAYPANEAGYVLKGKAYIKLNPIEALQYLRIALKINFDSTKEAPRSEIYNFISAALLELKEYDEAVVYAQKAINMQPNDIEYYLSKNIAIHIKYLYLNSQLAEVTEERMNLTELVAYKIQFWGLIKQLEGRVGKEKLREIKEYMQELEKIETIEANYNDIEARLVGVVELWKVVSNENGIPIHDPKDSASLVAKVESDHIKDEEDTVRGSAGAEETIEGGAAGGAGRELTPPEVVGASGGASSSTATVAQNREAEYLSTGEGKVAHEDKVDSLGVSSELGHEE